MAESTLSLDYTQIYREAASLYGGVRVYALGTVAISTSTVTLTGGVFPPWAAQGVIQIAGQEYTVASRDSDTQLTIDLTATVSSGTAYLLSQADQDAHLEIVAAINSGYRNFCYSDQWLFMEPNTTIDTVEVYSTGTITVSSGVVTLAGGTFPAWAASGELSVGGTAYPVNTRDSGTQVTLDDVTVAVSSGATYSIGQSTYDLPDDFGGILGQMTYRAGDSELYPPIRILSEYQIRAQKQQYDAYSYRPIYAGIRVKAFVATTGTRWEIVFGPAVPDAVYNLEYTYRALPNQMTPTNKYPLGGELHSETIRIMILAAIELKKDEQAGINAQMIPIMLDNSRRAEGSFAPDFLGPYSPQRTAIGNKSSLRTWGTATKYEGF